MTQSGARSWCRTAAAPLAVATCLLGVEGTWLRAQEAPTRLSDVELLQQAEVRENAGDFPAAELLYQQILDRDPASLSALLGLQRLLRVDAKLPDMIPYVQHHLEASPESPIGHQMLLRLYADLDRTSDFDRAAEEWIAAVPRSEIPYREIARLREQRGDIAGSLKVLERGRAKLGGQALALELGIAYARTGQPSDAAREWDSGIGRDAHGFLLVQRSLGLLPDGGASVVPLLVDRLTRRGASIERLRAAAQLAVSAGLGQRATEIAMTVARELGGNDRQSFLVDIARRAEAAQQPALAYWAYTRLLEEGSGALEPAALRGRVAELALLLGDTARARQSYDLLQTDASAGALERRRSLAQRVELATRAGRLDDASEGLDSLRVAFPGSSDGDAAAAGLAAALLRKGEPRDAVQRVLEGWSGPQVQRVQARLALEEGKVAEARAALLEAAPGLSGPEETEAIVLARLLGKLSEPSSRLLGQALRLRDEGRIRDAVLLLFGKAPGTPRDEQSALLDFAASMADQGSLEGEAEAIRRALIADHPEALETAPAMLALGRALERHPESLDEAKRLLERLVLDYPRSALVPQARRELEIINARVPRS